MRRFMRNVQRAVICLSAAAILCAPMGCSTWRKCKSCCDKPCCKKAAPADTTK